MRWPSSRVTTARLESDCDPRCPRKTFVLPLRTSVFTLLTLTSNSFSTASLICGLVALPATLNTTLLCSEAVVAFSVMTGATITSWALAGGTLPAGVTLGANGVISGTPTQSGTFTFTVQANASGANATKQLSLFVLAPLELQTLVNKTPPESGLTAKKLVGQPLSTGVKAVGGRPPYTFTAEGTMPPGLTLDPATGAITGSGTTAGRYRFTVTVTDGTGTKASVDWFITTLPLLDFTKGKGLRVGKVGQTYSARIPVRGKDSSTARFAVAGEIPPGLEVDEDGRLTGTLMKAGVYELEVFAFAENGAPISKVFRLRVRA